MHDQQGEQQPPSTSGDQQVHLLLPHTPLSSSSLRTSGTAVLLRREPLSCSHVFSSSAMSIRSFRSSSPPLNATLNVKNGLNETIQSIPMAEDGTYTFTSTYPIPLSPTLSSSSSSSSHPSAGARLLRKVTTIRAPKQSPIIINLNAADSSRSRHSKIMELPAPPVLSPSSSSPAPHSVSSPSHGRFSSTVPLNAGESAARSELAKEVRARVKAQQQQREDYSVFRQQLDVSAHDVRKLKREVDEVRSELQSERAAHRVTADQLASIRQSHEAARRPRDDEEHSELLRSWEECISTWESDKKEWQRVRQDLVQQQTIADLAVSALQDDQARLRAELDALRAGKAQAESKCATAERRLQAAVEEARMWQAAVEEERKRHAEGARQLEQLKSGYHALLETHIHQTALDSEQTDTAQTSEGAEGRLKLSRPSLLSPLLPRVQPVSSHVDDERAEEAKYAEEAAARPLDEGITSIVIDRAAQAEQHMRGIAERLTESHAALHQHVRTLSQSHSDVQQRLHSELDAHRTQARQLLEASAAHEKEYRDACTQLTQTSILNAALKTSNQSLEQQLHALKCELSAKEASQKELTDAQAKLAIQQSAMDRSNVLITDLTLQLSQRREEVRQLQSQLEESKGQVQWASLASSHSSESLVSLQSSSAATIRQWQAEKRVWSSEKESFVAEREHLHAHLQQAEESREELTEQLHEARAKEDRLEEELRLLRFEASEASRQLLDAHAALQQKDAFIHFVQTQVQRYVHQQAALRGKLGRLIASEKGKSRVLKKTATELRAVLRESLTSLLRAERNARNLQLERDEFDSLLHGALLKLQSKGNHVAQAAGKASSQNEAELDENLHQALRDKEELSAVLRLSLAELRKKEEQNAAMEAEATEAEEKSANLRRRKDEMKDVISEMLGALSLVEADYRRSVEEGQHHRAVSEAALSRLQDEVERVKRSKEEVSDVLQQALQALHVVEEAQQRTLKQNEELTGLIHTHERLHASNDETVHRLYEEAAHRTHFTVDDLRAELARLRALCSSQQEIIAQLTEVKDQLKELVDRLLAGGATKLREEEAKLHQLQAQADVAAHKSLQSQLHKAHEELVRVEAERIAVASQAQSLQRSLEDTETRLADTDERLSHLEAVENQLHAEAAQAEEERDLLAEQLAMVEAERQRLEAESAQLTRELAELSEQVARAEQREHELIALQQQRESLIDTLLQQCRDAQAQEEADSQQRAAGGAAEAQLTASLQSQVAGLTASLEESEAHLHQAMEDLDRMTAESKANQAALTDSRQQLDAQQQTITQLRSDKAELEDVLQDAWATVLQAEKAAEDRRDAVRQEKTRMGRVIADMRERVQSGHRNVHELSSVLREVLRALNEADEERRSAQQQEEALSAEQARLAEAVAEAAASSASLQEELDNAREQLSAAQVKEGEDAQELAHQTDEYERLSQEAAELQDALQVSQQAVEDAQADTQRAEQQAEQLKRELTDTEQRLAHVAEQLSASQHELSEAQHTLNERETELEDALSQSRSSQEQLDQVQVALRSSSEELSHTRHQLSLLTDSLTAATAAAEEYADQLQQRSVSGEERTSELQSALAAREEEVESLTASLRALEDEFARHNDEDHAAMDEQSKRWQEDQDALHHEIAQLKANASQQTDGLNTERDQAVQAAQTAEERVQTLEEQVKAAEHHRSTKDDELRHLQEQLRSVIVRHEEVVRKLEHSERTFVAEKARAAHVAQTQSDALAAKDQELQTLNERVVNLKAEALRVHTHNGGSNDVALNAVIECQAASIESQILVPPSPTHSSASPTPRSVKVAGKPDPMLKVLVGSHKKEVSLLKGQLEKSQSSCRSLEKKVKELEKRSASLHSLKSQAEYKSKDVTEQGRTWELKVRELEQQVQELLKEKAKLSSAVTDLTYNLTRAHMDVERVIATEREKEERALVKEQRWAEERSRLEQRIAALHGKGGTHRRRKSGSSVTFKDDSALLVGDLRLELTELHEENARLLASLRMLTEHRAADEADAAHTQEPLAEEDEEQAEEQPEQDGHDVIYTQEPSRVVFEADAPEPMEEPLSEASVSVNESVSQYRAVDHHEKVMDQQAERR